MFITMNCFQTKKHITRQFKGRWSSLLWPWNGELKACEKREQGRYDYMILEAFSNFADSMILSDRTQGNGLKLHQEDLDWTLGIIS